MSKLDNVVQAIRSDLSDIATDHDKGDCDLYRFVGVETSRSYNFILDAFYLLEDTQLAKASFRDSELRDLDFGTLYLLYYGLLNACYMQQQATLVLCRELGVTDGLETIKTADIVNFRNSFSAHCSGLMNPDTNVGGKVTTLSEVSDDQKTTILYF